MVDAIRLTTGALESSRAADFIVRQRRDTMPVPLIPSTRAAHRTDLCAVPSRTGHFSWLVPSLRMGLFTFERFTSRRRRPPPPAQHLRADGRDSRIPAPSSSTSSRRSCAKSRPRRVDKGRHDPIRLVFPGSRGTTVQGLKGCSFAASEIARYQKVVVGKKVETFLRS